MEEEEERRRSHFSLLLSFLSPPDSSYSPSPPPPSHSSSTSLSPSPSPLSPLKEGYLEGDAFTRIVVDGIAHPVRRGRYQLNTLTK